MQYIQTKEVLNNMDKTSEIMKHLNESGICRFQVSLPPSKMNASSARNEQLIPCSRIAQQLETELLNIAVANRNNYVSDEEEKRSPTITITTIGNTDNCDMDWKPIMIIIDTFRQLYNKYIDPNNAVFMLNISSNNRQNLTHLFDNDYYNSAIKNRNKNGNKNHSRNGKSSIFSINLIKSVTDSLTKNETELDKVEIVRSFINEELEKRFKKFKNTNNDINTIVSQNEILQWLLGTILQQFERTAIEIGLLMNDSFSRFARNDNQLYQKLSMLAESRPVH